MSDTATINLPPALSLKIDLTDEQFFQLCQNNRDLRFERTAQGEIIIMPPTGGNTGKRNVKITTQLEIWNSQNNWGIVFDSNTGYKLPNGADRVPDASWVNIERWNALTAEQQDKFIPLCPDFAVELCSPSDSLETLRSKMQEYIENGTLLAWLIDPKRKVVEIYRPNKESEILSNPATVSGEEILPEFILDLSTIF